MKPRRVFIMFEVETDQNLRDLNKKGNYEINMYKEVGGLILEILQVQVNVAKKKK